MKILITGHQGFIGQNMMEALSSEHEVDGLEWNDTLPDLLGYDWVIHLGAITSTTERDVEKVMEFNYDFSRYLLIECEKAGVNLQYASSASVYGPYTECKENGPKFPQSPYAWSKYLFDRFFEKFAEQGRWNKITVQGFRYFNVHGPYEDHKEDQASPFYKFTKQAKENGVIELFEGSLTYCRDFIHVDQVIDIHKKFLNIKKSGIYNVGTGKSRSFDDVAREIAGQHNATIKYIPMPENLKHQYQKFTCADLTLLSNTLNDVENNR
jgi:ADP-L-glycero-D-manno-heptose 6-epimerase